MNTFRALIHDDHGFIISAELVVISTLLVVGLVTGLQYIQAAVVGEMQDVGSAISSLNQSYSYTGKHGCCHWGHGFSSWTGGSCFADTVDEPHAPVDFACLDNNVGCQNVALTGVTTPCEEACDVPCESPCGDPCADRCGDPCENPCGEPCADRCGDPCRCQCRHSCGSPCSDPCANRCDDPCGNPCGSPCGHSYDNGCDDPCSAAGRPARIYGSDKEGGGSRSAEYATLDGGPYPALPPLRRCPVNNNPCPGCSDDADFPECGPQLYPTLLSDCRPCSPTDVQIIW